jgi:peptidoglycan/LPS O-acetylase OafA/YrhL
VKGGVRSEVGHVPGADTVRAAALLAVMLFHYTALVPHATDPWLAALARVPWLEAAVAHGWLGVDFFFVLSGFLLGLPWFLHARRGEPAPDALAFYRRRFWRLAPAYYVHLAVFFGAVMPFLAGMRLARWDALVVGWNVVAHGLFMQAATPLTAASLGLNGALWTLSIEAQFYLVLPWIAPLFARSPRTLLAGFAAMAIAWRIGCAHGLDGLVAAIQGLGHRWSWSEPTVRGFLAAQAPAYLGHFALGLVLGRAWIARRAGREAIRAPRHASLLDRIGRVSYSAYLWHVPVLLVLLRVTAGAAGWALFPLYLGTVLGLAALSWRYLEPPFAGWRRERVPTASAVTMASDCSAATPQSTAL